MNYKDVLKEAKVNLYGKCKVCLNCNGKACAGEVPGMGGTGTGSAFIENYESLQRVKIKMRLVHEAKDPCTETTLFGEKLSIPVFAAPVSGTTYNMGGKFTESDYISWVINGCLDAGIHTMVGDAADDAFFPMNLEELKKVDKGGIAIIKPWKDEMVFEKIKAAEEAGVFALGMDVDAAGLITLALFGKPVGPKTLEEIKSYVDATKLPFIIKGVMSIEDAEMAIASGADAIVVSNHGGRVLDGTPGVADVLPSIAKKVKGRITVLADGGVRTGVDILKMIALGADGVLIGRPFVTASFGGQREGVKLYVEKLAAEFKSAMILTGCKDVASITEDILWK